MAEDDAPGADTGTGTGTGTATEAPEAAADVPDSIQSTVAEQDGPPATITDGGAGRGKVEATAVAAHSNDATAEPSGASTAASAPGKDDAQLVDDLLTKSVCEDLKSAFGPAAGRGSGSKGMSQQDLSTVVRRHSSVPIADGKLAALFQRLDVQQEGEVSWKTLASCVMVGLQRKDDAAARSRTLKTSAPLVFENNFPSQVNRVCYNEQRQLLTLSDDCMLRTWDPRSTGGVFKPVHEREITLANAPMSDALGTKRKKWSTDFCFMPKISKAAVGSGERDIWFFDSASPDFQAQFVITSLPETPGRMTTMYDAAADATTLLFGDTGGALTAIVFPRGYGMHEKFRTRIAKGKPPMWIPSSKLVIGSTEYGGVHLRRWHAHTEWVNEVMWVGAIHSFISCSNDPVNSIILGEVIPNRVEPPKSVRKSLLAEPPQQQINGLPTNRLQKTFTVPRGGVRSCSYSKKLGLIASGGPDHVLRFWTPWMSDKASFQLDGHKASIMSVEFVPGGERVVTLDVERDLMVWDPKAQACVTSISEASHGLTQEITVLAIHPATGAFFMFGRKQTGVILPKSSAHDTAHEYTHDKPVRCVIYNRRFDQVITGCDGGIVKTFAMQTGALVVEFTISRHAVSPISSMTLDATGTRLITSCENGEAHVWLVVNGQHLCEYVEDDAVEMSARREVAAVAFVKEGQVSNVLTAGWSRRVVMYPDVRTEQPATVKPEGVYGGEGTAHGDDITAMLYLGHNTVATGAYNGEIKVWMTSRGTLIKTITPRDVPGSSTTSSGSSSSSGSGAGAGNVGVGAGVVHTVRAVYGLVKLPTQAPVPSSASPSAPKATRPTLIACQANGIFLWDTVRGKNGVLHSAFVVDTTFRDNRHTPLPGAPPPPPVEARCVALTPDAGHLVVGDSEGHVTVYSIAAYCKQAQGGPNHKSHPPPVFASWRATHEAAVTAVQMVSLAEEAPSSWGMDQYAHGAGTHTYGQEFVLTGSVDCRVRLFTLDGHLVGTFGQAAAWDVAQTATWKHPALPLEIMEADEAAHRAEEEEEKLEALSHQAKTTRRRSTAAWGFGEVDNEEIEALQREAGPTATNQQHIKSYVKRVSSAASGGIIDIGVIDEKAEPASPSTSSAARTAKGRWGNGKPGSANRRKSFADVAEVVVEKVQESKAVRRPSTAPNGRRRRSLIAPPIPATPHAIAKSTYHGTGGSNLYVRRYLHKPEPGPQRPKSAPAPAVLAKGADTVRSMFTNKFQADKAQAEKDKDDAAELKVDWIEPGLPRKLGNWERNFRAEQAKRDRITASARTSRHANASTNTTIDDTNTNTDTNAQPLSLPPASGAVSVSGHGAGGGPGQPRVARGVGGRAPRPSKVLGPPPIASGLPFSSAVFKSMSLNTLEELVIMPAPEMGTSVLSRATAALRTGGSQGSGKQQSRQSPRQRRHGASTAARGEGHLKGLTGPPVPARGAGTTRLPQGPLASLGKGARGRRGSVITPNVQTDPESGLYS